MNGKKQFLIPLMICVVLCVGIPSVLMATGHTAEVRSVVLGVTEPIQNAFTDAGRWVGDFFAHFTQYSAVKEENERLRAQIASMEDTVRRAEGILSENEYLSDFLELKENHADYRFLKCEIVSAIDTGYALTLTVNAGENEGIAVGYPVITAEGVIGRVSEVGPNYAKITPLTELSSSVGAYVERTGESGIALGDYLCRTDGKLLLSYLEADSKIRDGDRVRTSGTGGTLPRGLLIGTVSEVRWDPATMARTAVIAPAVKVSELRDVMILTDFALYNE